MIDRALGEFSLSVSPTAEVDAQEAFGRVITGETAPLCNRAMLLISGLLTSEEGSTVTRGNGSVSVKVVSPRGRFGSRSGIAGRGSLGGLRSRRGPTSRGWSPHLLSKIADRWGLVSGTDGAWVWFELDLPQGADR